MKNNKVLSFLFLAFCWAIFSFAVFTPQGFMYPKEWTMTTVLNCLANIAIALLIITPKQPVKIVNYGIILYVIFTIAKAMYQMNEYIKLFHGQQSGIVLIVITGILIVYMLNFYDSHTAQSAVPLLGVVLVMLSMAVFINLKLVSPANIYFIDAPYTAKLQNFTIFDWVIMLAVMFKDEKQPLTKPICSLIGIVSSIYIGFAVFQGLCLHGNSLYSVSPLQALFQISSTNLVKRYENVFVLMLYFSYFSVLLLSVSAYNHTKRKIKKHTSLELLLIIPLFWAMPYIKPEYFIYVQIVVLIGLIFGSKEVKTIAKI